MDQTYQAEIPDIWRKVLESSCVKPESFNAIDMIAKKFLKLTEFFQDHFLALCPFPSRPIRELKMSESSPT
ncbi:hypothetical protein RRG08_013932 [Elysia crispata]|uniref:Uncharacterized protein n=1 Tax=Elysia crispata TaxID=231223 RepID=A0AAE1AE59_9GAST|nr:hypothetical protein RRG08_013932 [Elysia crispata]